MVAARAGRVVVGLVALAYGLAVAWSATTNLAGSSYGTSGRALALISSVAGLALLASGAVALLAPVRDPVGALLLGLGVAWSSADVAAWSTLPAGVRSGVALVAPAAVAPLLLHLASVAPDGGRLVRSRAGWVVLGYAVTLVTTLAWVVVYDPFVDVDCWRSCSDNGFLLSPAPSAAVLLARVADVAALVIRAATVAIAVVRRRHHAAARRTTLPDQSMLGVAAAGAVGAATALLRLLRVESPTDPLFAALFVAESLALVLIAVCLMWSGRARRLSVAVDRLSHELTARPDPEPLVTTLRRLLDDPTVDVAYVVPSGLVDEDGTRAAVSTGRASVDIARDGRTIAVVSLDPAWADSGTTLREIGAAAEVAVDNERLRAQLLAQVEELRESQERIVQTGDAARRSLERDLHDGAQHQVLGLLLRLRQASDAARSRGDIDTAAQLDAACDETLEALTELRTLAHGIYPAILTDAGLAAALRTYADSSPTPVRLTALLDDRVPDEVERTAYLVVTAAVESAPEAAEVTVSVRHEPAGVVTEVGADHLAMPADVVATLQARVGARRGALSLSSTSVRAVIPCA